MTSLVRIIVLLLLVCGAAPSLHAEPRSGTELSAKEKEKRGKALYERGKELANKGRYTEALVELTKGYELTGRPLFLFNMAECARALKDTVQARELYERYLAAEANGPFANAARTRLVELAPPAEPVAPPPAEPAPAVVIPPPSQAAASIERSDPQPAPLRDRVPPKSESHLGRNLLIAGIAVALVAGSVAVYVATRPQECGTGCVDLR